MLMKINSLMDQETREKDYEEGLLVRKNNAL